MFHSSKHSGMHISRRNIDNIMDKKWNGHSILRGRLTKNVRENRNSWGKTLSKHISRLKRPISTQFRECPLFFSNQNLIEEHRILTSIIWTILWIHFNLMKWANIMRIAIINNITGSLRQFFFLCHSVMMWFLQPQTMGRTSWNHCYRFHFHFDDKYENIRRKNSIDADGNLISVSMVYELLKV